MYAEGGAIVERQSLAQKQGSKSGTPQLQATPGRGTKDEAESRPRSGRLRKAAERTLIISSRSRRSQANFSNSAGPDKVSVRDVISRAQTTDCSSKSS